MSTLSEMYKEGLAESKVELTGTPIDLLLDADIPAYRAAAATDGKSWRVKGVKGSLTVGQRFKYKKQADKEADRLASSGYIIDITVDYEPEDVKHAIANVKSMVEGIRKEVEDKYKRPVVIYPFITGKENFRDTVSHKYKSSRRLVRRPANLKACKEFLIEHYDAEWVEGYEADDLIAIESYVREHKDCIVCSIDKDLLQIPGTHYHFINKEFIHISKAEGRHLFWKQVLTGDKVDDINGLHGIGPKKSDTILKELYKYGSDFEYYKVILSTYMKHTPKQELESERDYRSRVIKQITQTAQLLHLCKEFDGIWQPPLANDLFPHMEHLTAIERCQVNTMAEHGHYTGILEFFAKNMAYEATDILELRDMTKLCKDQVDVPILIEHYPTWAFGTLASGYGSAAEKLKAEIDETIMGKIIGEAKAEVTTRSAPKPVTPETIRKHMEGKALEKAKYIRKIKGDF